MDEVRSALCTHVFPVTRVNENLRLKYVVMYLRLGSVPQLVLVVVSTSP